ncbi:MAG: hypothetical protein ACT4P7_05400 [Gemmatimonadaceae bacterium]
MRYSCLRQLVACACLACSGLTEVTNTGIVQPDAEDNPSGAAARWAGATRLFTSAVISAINTTAVFTDEWINADFPGNSANTLIDARRPPSDNFQTAGMFTSTNNNRMNLKFARDALVKYSPTPRSRIAQMLAYTGFLENHLGEHFCSGIPFSEIDANGSATYGGATTTAQVYAMALSHLDSAATFATDSARVLNFVRVTRARVYLNLGRFSDAATEVAQVPTAFFYNLEINASVAGQTNTLYNSMIGRGISVAYYRDGGTGINWVAARDPRVPTQRLAQPGTDGVTQVHQYMNITSLGSPITISSGIEARLIEAEAALRAGNVTTWLAKLNEARATRTGLPALADPGTEPARVDLLFAERAFWMFLTAHRLGDFRRLVRQYARPVNSVYPNGTYKDGVSYGSEVNFAPPVQERPNKSYTGCIDRNP